MKKTPYIQSKRHKTCKIIFYVLILLLICCLFGCAKQQDPVDTAANVAHQQIQVIRDSLPTECQTKAIQTELDAADRSVDSVVETCETQKKVLSEEKLRWKWAFLATVVMIAAYIARKVMK